jgi:NAD(P)-dependent dehydrogenase (short-subunit alcohol dehydrogenase family)
MDFSIPLYPATLLGMAGMIERALIALRKKDITSEGELTVFNIRPRIMRVVRIVPFLAGTAHRPITGQFVGVDGGFE